MRWGQIVIALMAFIPPGPLMAQVCSQSPTLEALVAPWNADDQQYLGGRTDINYYFEMDSRDYSVVYFDSKGQISSNSARQTFRSDPLYRHEKALGVRLIDATDHLISLDFQEVSRPEMADLLIVGYCMKTDVKEGAVSQNAEGTQYIMVLNGCRGIATGQEDPVWLFLHEFGHALGLEHPFSDIDGDCLFDNDPWSTASADASLTVMAYKPDPAGPARFFTDYDIAVLRSIWGEE